MLRLLVWAAGHPARFWPIASKHDCWPRKSQASFFSLSSARASSCVGLMVVHVSLAPLTANGFGVGRITCIRIGECNSLPINIVESQNEGLGLYTRRRTQTPRPPPTLTTLPPPPKKKKSRGESEHISTLHSENILGPPTTSMQYQFFHLFVSFRILSLLLPLLRLPAIQKTLCEKKSIEDFFCSEGLREIVAIDCAE